MLLYHFWAIEMLSVNVNVNVIGTWICAEIVNGIVTWTLSATWNEICVVATGIVI